MGVHCSAECKISVAAATSALRIRLSPTRNVPTLAFRKRSMSPWPLIPLSPKNPQGFAPLSRLVR
jgi:hypothetical protein